MGLGIGYARKWIVGIAEKTALFLGHLTDRSDADVEHR
jgi:hypothetical protein